MNKWKTSSSSTSSDCRTKTAPKNGFSIGRIGATKCTTTRESKSGRMVWSFKSGTWLTQSSSPTTVSASSTSSQTVNTTCRCSNPSTADSTPNSNFKTPKRIPSANCRFSVNGKQSWPKTASKSRDTAQNSLFTREWKKRTTSSSKTDCCSTK